MIMCVAHTMLQLIFVSMDTFSTNLYSIPVCVLS